MVCKGKTCRRRSFEDKVDGAANAIRDMFISAHYKNNVPNSDVRRMLASEQWDRRFTQKAVVEAWTGMVKDGFIAKRKGTGKTSDAIWFMPYAIQYEGAPGMRVIEARVPCKKCRRRAR